MAAKEQGRESSAAKLRAFVAIPLPEDVAGLLGEIQSGLQKENWPVKWVRPESIHLTLKFLGDIPESEVEQIVSAMQTAVRQFAPLTLSAAGLGAFPSVKRPRVLWCGIGGESHVLARLHAGLDEQLARQLGIEKEGKAFKGHLTLGRVKGKIKPDAVVEAVTSYGDVTSRAFVADSLCLYRSELKPGGAVYTELARVPLGTE
ncbi:MAG: RNA 2',3'-cyclic phosphodiesterase [Desulfosalsimonadaceae bacterium]